MQHLTGLRYLKATGAHTFFQATVGAGLPIINTIKQLRGTGDRLVLVEGVLSDTMSVIFNGVNSGKRFSEAVQDAIEQGYTEADLKDDLSGFDTARKVPCPLLHSVTALPFLPVQAPEVLLSIALQCTACDHTIGCCTILRGPFRIFRTLLVCICSHAWQRQDSL
jgi:hypothetical protein